MEQSAVTPLLLEARANASVTDRYGHSTLRWAAKTNQHRTLQLLLDARCGDKVDVGELAGRGHLRMSFLSTSASPTVLHVRTRHSVREEDGDVNEALRLALRSGHADCVRVLFTWVGELILPADLSDFMDDDDQRRAAVRAILAAYASLPVEGLGRCVARAFKRWPCATLEGIINLAASSGRLSSRLRTRDMIQSEALITSAERLQLAVPACLHELGDQLEVNKLLRSPEGRSILPLAVRAHCKQLLAQPTVQHFLQAEWLGELLEELFSTYTLRSLLLRSVALSLLLLAQLPLLPLISLYPPLERRLKRAKWRSLMLEGVMARGLAFSTDRPYMLDVPIVKFAVAMVLDSSLTLILSFVDLSGALTYHRPLVSLLLAWVAAALVFELKQSMSDDSKGIFSELRALFTFDGRSQFSSDMFQVLDIIALLLTNVALVAQLLSHPSGERASGEQLTQPLSESIAPSLCSIAVFFLWLRALRILAQFPTLGPLVLMVAKMTKDVLKWASLLAAVLAAFVSALYKLYRKGPGSEGVAPFDADLDHDCIDFDADFQSWGRTLLLVLEGTLTNENWLECARNSSHPVLGSVIMYFCQMLVAILLFNMLIAQLAKTFDKVYEAQVLNYQFLLAQTVISWRRTPTTAPPLNWLMVPQASVSFALAAVSRFLRSRDAMAQRGVFFGDRLAKFRREFTTRRRGKAKFALGGPPHSGGVPREGRFSVFARTAPSQAAGLAAAAAPATVPALPTAAGADGPSGERSGGCDGGAGPSVEWSNASGSCGPEATMGAKHTPVVAAEPVAEWRSELVAGHVRGQYATSDFFERWNNRHPEEQLAERLSESILRHENDYLVEREGTHALKAEGVEKLVSARIAHLEQVMSRRMELVAAENGEVLAELAAHSKMLVALLEAPRGQHELAGVPASAAPHNRGSSHLHARPHMLSSGAPRFRRGTDPAPARSTADTTPPRASDEEVRDEERHEPLAPSEAPASARASQNMGAKTARRFWNRQPAAARPAPLPSGSFVRQLIQLPPSMTAARRSLSEHAPELRQLETALVESAHGWRRRTVRLDDSGAEFAELADGDLAA